MTATVFSDVVCHLGEGPSYHPASGRVHWFDILEKRLLEKRPDRSGTIVHQLPVDASVLAAVDDDRQLMVAAGGLYVRRIADGALSLHRPLVAEDPGIRSNDGRVHPAGALWLSTMSRTAAEGAATIWWYRDGELRPLIGGLTIPNGIAFAPDGTHAFYADTRPGRVWRIPTDPSTGLPVGDPSLFLDGGDGGPDGAVVDADGLYWSARWGAGAVIAYDRDGREVARRAVPASQSSCPVFVGERMVVTSAQEGMDAAAREADPLSGQTFLLDGPFRGRPDPAVRLGEG